MRFALACACAAAVAVAAAQDSAAVEAAARAAKEPPKLTVKASAADVLTACREMLPRRQKPPPFRRPATHQPSSGG